MKSRFVNDVLWDADGVAWEVSNPELLRNEINTYLQDPDVTVVIHKNMKFKWVPKESNEEVWLKEIEPNFHDQPDWKLPPFWKPRKYARIQQLPFHAELRTSEKGQLIFFDDRD